MNFKNDNSTTATYQLMHYWPTNHLAACCGDPCLSDDGFVATNNVKGVTCPACMATDEYKAASMEKALKRKRPVDWALGELFPGSPLLDQYDKFEC